MTDSPKESQAMRKARELCEQLYENTGFVSSWSNQFESLIAAALTEARAQALAEAFKAGAEHARERAVSILQHAEDTADSHNEAHLLCVIKELCEGIDVEPKIRALVGAAKDDA